MVVGSLIFLPNNMEAFLIVAILAVCLRATRQKRAQTALTAAVSLAVLIGIALSLTHAVDINSPALKWLEQVPAAFGLATIVWLAVRLGRARTAAAIESFSGPEAVALVLLGFIVVLRQLVELASFAAESAAGFGPAEALPGIILGLVLGAVTAVAAYLLLKSLRPSGFQTIGSLSLIFSAIAMAVRVVTDLGTSGLLPPMIARVVWDVNWIVPQNAWLGRLLHIFSGYDSTPGVPAVVFYLSYLPLLALISWSARNRAAAKRAPADSTTPLQTRPVPGP